MIAVTVSGGDMHDITEITTIGMNTTLKRMIEDGV